MPGKKHRLIALETRKQLLVLESELNRTHLLQELNGVKQEVQELAERLRAAGAVLKLATDVFSVFSQGSTEENSHKKESKENGGFFRLGNLSRIATGLWNVFHSRDDS